MATRSPRRQATIPTGYGLTVVPVQIVRLHLIRSGGSIPTRTVNNASKDACTLILADWAQHGRLTAQEPPAPAPEKSEKPPVQPVLVPANMVTQATTTQETAQEEQTRADRNTVVVSSTAPAQEESLGAAAERAKQHQECLKLAADNPSISCK
jgi:hypothetical protein